MPRPSNSEERREQIGRALQRVMSRSGYEGATVAEVAREAGLTTGLVHYHFRSKQEILLYVLDRLVQRHRLVLEEALAAAAGDAAGELAAFVDVHLALGP